MTAKEVTTSVVHSKLWEEQHVGEDGCKEAFTTAIKVIEFVSHGIKAENENAKLSEQNTDVQAKLEKTFSGECAMRG